MNDWHTEFLTELHRREILGEAEHIRLEKIALQGRVYHPGFFARTMFRFANWMITTGKQLRERYEVPSVDCSQTPSGSLVQ
jgi:hypothetical protein